jgi:hypothetical protein
MITKLTMPTKVLGVYVICRSVTVPWSGLLGGSDKVLGEFQAYYKEACFLPSNSKVNLH